MPDPLPATDSARQPAAAPASPLAIIILAAGRGTRLQSALPKVLHRVAHRPMIAHVAAAAAALNPTRVLCVVSAPGMDEVTSAARQAAPHAEAVVQTQQLGTGHAVLACADALAGFDGLALVVCGDTPLLTSATLQRLAEAAASPSAAPVLALLTMEPADPAQYGRVLTAADGSVERIVEYKDATATERAVRLCNAGMLAAPAQALLRWLRAVGNANAQGEYYLPDVVGIARAEGVRCLAVRMDAQEAAGVNTRAQLAEAEALMQQRLRRAAMEAGVGLLAPETVFLSYDTRIGPDTLVHPYVVCGPGVQIGARCDIRAFSHLEQASVADDAVVGPYARLRPGAVIGPGAHIGNFVEIKQADIAAGAKVNHLSYIGDAQVGAGANIGAGTITCNYDGYGKYRTDIGAGAFIGSNSALVAPVRVGAGAIIGAGSTITQDVPADALALTRSAHTAKPGWAARFRLRRGGKA